VPMPKVDDELSFLVDSFNQMTQRIGRARYAAEMSKNELQLQHNYLETVMGALTTGVIALDKNGKITTANLAAEMVLGLPLSEFRKQPLTNLSEKKPVLDPFVDRMWQSIQGEALPANTQITLYRENGHQTLLCRHSVLPAASAKDQGHVLVFDDVTELVHAQKDAAWAEVARRLAHEIKNPLTPIQLASQHLQRSFDPSDDNFEEKIRIFSDKMIRQIDTLSSIATEFSNFAKMPRSKIGKIDLIKVLKEALGLFNEIEEIKMEFVNNTSGNVLMMAGDDEQLTRVFNNLIKNGIQSIPDDREGEIVVVIEEKQDTIEVEVKDNGIGIGEEKKEKIFVPNFTTKSAGSGLGLAMVKSIVENHSGHVWFESNPPNGTSFFVSLPRQIDE